MMGEDAEGMEEMTGVPLEAVTRKWLAGTVQRFGHVMVIMVILLKGLRYLTVQELPRQWCLVSCHGLGGLGVELVVA